MNMKSSDLWKVGLALFSFPLLILLKNDVSISKNNIISNIVVSYTSLLKTYVSISKNDTIFRKMQMKHFQILISFRSISSLCRDMRSGKEKSPNSTFQISGDTMFKRPYLSNYWSDFVHYNTIRKHLMSAFVA